MARTLTVRLSKESLLRHMLLNGSSGGGKTTLLSNMFYDLVRTSNKKRDACLILCEPHGDFSLKAGLMRIIPRDRLVFISSAMTRLAGADEKYTFTFNPFEHDGTEDMKYHLQNELTQAIKELLDSSDHATQYGITVHMATVLSNAIAITLASPEPSILTLQRMFTDDNEDLLEIGRNFPHPQVRSFMTQQWHKESFKQTRSSILVKLTYFLTDPYLYQILAPSHSTLALDRFIEEGRVIVVHTPVGVSSFVQSFVGRLIVARVYSAMLRREMLPMHKRKKVFMFIDEFQSGYITKSFISALQQARKFSLGLVLSIQSLRQISDNELKASILTNTFWKATTVIDAKNRALLADEMDVTSDVIANLKPMQFLIKKMGNSEAFKFTTAPLSNSLFYDKAEADELYKHLLYSSGLYVKAPPPLPPAPPTEQAQSKNKNYEKKKKDKKDDNPFSDVQPAF